jgi:hypothetical protein
MCNLNIRFPKRFFSIVILVVPLLFTICFSRQEKPLEQSTDKAVQLDRGKGKDVWQIPFKIIDGLIIVPVKVNGSKELNMILDTGMNEPVVTLFHFETGKELGLWYVGPVNVSGPGDKGAKTASMTLGATLTISGIEFKWQTIIVIDESRSTSRWTMDGIIGKTIFDSYVVEIDFEKSIVIVYDPQHFKKDPKTEAIPLFLQMGMPVVEAVVSIDGEKEVPLKLMVDTGGRHNLSLNTNSQKKIFPPGNSIKGIIGIGVQGEYSGAFGRVSRLQLGEFVFRDVMAEFPDENSNAGISGLVDGDLGIIELSRFKVIFDYPHRKMLLTPNKKFAKPFEFNMAGLFLEQNMDGSFMVRDVIKNSPGFRQGIQKDDRIVAINGKDIHKYRYIEVFDMFRQEGEKIKVTIRRESGRFNFTLTLKRLI